MPLTYEWLIPEQVIGLRWSGDVDFEELNRLDEEMIEVLNTAQKGPVHFISYELDLVNEPTLKDYIQARSPRHAHFGWYIIIQPRHKAFARMVAQMACTILGLRFRIVSDEDSAWKVLERSDPAFKRPSSESAV